ncbi:MAG: hybrid sensor histidine kinase/response regulator [bacterium]|nr:hybrid sensor histidine kinase/response regulator [bacterium]
MSLVPMETLDYFRMEASERLERLSAGLMALENSTEDQTLIGDLFREAHSLKGAASVAGLGDVSEICHKMEDLLSKVRDGTEQASEVMIDALLAATDAVHQLVEAGGQEQDCAVGPAQIIERLSNLEPSSNATEVTSPAAPSPDVPTEDDDQPEATLESGVTPEPEPTPIPNPEPEASTPDDPRVEDSPEDEPPPAEEEKVSSPRVEDSPSPRASTSDSPMDTVRLGVDMLSALANLTGELMVAGDRLRQRLGTVKELHDLIRSECNRHRDAQGIQDILRPIATSARGLVDAYTADFAAVEPLITGIHEQVLDTRMLPVSVLFDQLPRFVRDYCRQENIRANLHTEGALTRMDRQVLEQLRDPIIHLIRNALSHGIETPEERRKLAKNPTGTVSLVTSRRGDRIRITCEDDGRGIDHKRVLAKAISSGTVTEVEADGLTAQQIENLILRPGFSTSEMITDVSGRGVGMDVVVGRMEAIRGTLGIESEPKKFTRFVLEFPASVATLEGLLVQAGGHTYVVPTVSVVRTTRVELAKLQSTCGKATVSIDGQAVPLMMLADLLGRAEFGGDASDAFPAVVIRHRDLQIAVGVERLLGVQTVVGKSLGDHLRSIRGVVGATILGTGLPALILELGQLVQDGGTNLRRFEGQDGASELEEELAPILIVDDSLTTRMMERSILESAGYIVDMAVSAEDALQKIEDTTYRLMVVDVEMPGLNGFQLTRKLRDDERFADWPIIIVTSLAKEEHRREGLDAGANAYIVKGEFDQSNLLETVERLVGG